MTEKFLFDKGGAGKVWGRRVDAPTCLPVENKNGECKQVAGQIAKQSDLGSRHSSQMLNALQKDIQNLNKETGEIRQVLQERLPKMDGLDEFHQQHAKLLDGFLERHVENLFRCLIPIIDRTDDHLKTVKRQAKSESGNNVLTKTVDFLSGIKIELMALLSTQGIEPFRTTTNKFSGKYQQAVKFVECNERSQNGYVRRRLRPGYRRNSKILRPELVEVYKFSVSI